MPRDSSLAREALSAKIDASSNNIPTSFGSGAGSKILTGIDNCQHMAITSTVEGRIAVAYRAKGSTVPTAVQLYIPAAPTDGEVWGFFDDIELGSTIYIKSDTGSDLTSGIFTVSVW